MGVKITGIEKLVAKLENTAKASSRGARDAMDKGSKDIMDLSKLHAPVDKGNLEDAHKIKKTKDGINGRFTFSVYVDPNTPASDDGDVSKTVGDYMFEMHDGVYELGELSKAKQEDVGVVVGPKFLERAIDELEEKIISDVELGALKGVGK